MFKRTTVVIVILALSTLASPLSASGPDRHVVALSRFNDVDSAYSTTGKVKIELREVRVRTTGSDGQSVTLRIFLLFEPQSGAFSWIVTDEVSATDASMQTNWFKSDRAAFLKDNSLIMFTAQMAPLLLYIHDYPGHASSMDDAEKKALRSTAELNDPPREVDVVRPSHSVPLTGLSLDFVHAPGNAIFGPQPRVIDVRWDGQHWLVTLKARWTETITLDAGYYLESMKTVEGTPVHRASGITSLAALSAAGPDTLTIPASL